MARSMIKHFCKTALLSKVRRCWYSPGFSGYSVKTTVIMGEMNSCEPKCINVTVRLFMMLI